MSQFSSVPFQFKIEPPLESQRRVNIVLNPITLMNVGLNIPVQIMTSSIYRKGQDKEPFKTITLMAHFDTGASKTSIDIKIAEHLGLSATGEAKQRTAGGERVYPTYAIDLLFPSTQLTPFLNLQVNSCDLCFSFELFNEQRINQTNLGILIGRDIMSKWNIVWNGPTSSVYISD